jgi:hypothetical protein
MALALDGSLRDPEDECCILDAEVFEIPEYDGGSLLRRQLSQCSDEVGVFVDGALFAVRGLLYHRHGSFSPPHGSAQLAEAGPIDEGGQVRDGLVS